MSDAFAFDLAASRAPARDYQIELVRELAKATRSAQPGARLCICVATGGGKTRIANDWIWEHGLPRGLRILWVTKDWPLLRQAAADLSRRRMGAASRLGYVGTEGARHLGGLAERTDASIVYTTIQTWRARKDGELRGVQFDLVVIDEVHWGEGKQAYRDLYRRYRSRAVFVGLTATPREGTGFETVGRVYDYATLASKGWLARLEGAETVRTGVSWAPGRSGSNGDFDRGSLAELARSAARNRLIADTYAARRGDFGKTLVFACDIEHAIALAELLKMRRISATELHSEMAQEDRLKAIDEFTHGRVRVLVNVAMMTHGVDVPDIETIFLARPTASTTLFAQMVGRAVRTTPSKSSFRLVDFVDNLEAHGEVLVSAREHFGALVAGPRARYVAAPRTEEHVYARAPFEHVERLAGYEELAGFDVQPDQTFGVEIELTRDGFDGRQPRDWFLVAEALRAAIPAPKAKRAFGEYHDEEKDHGVWNVEWDASCGWEITSRVLSGAAGFFEIADVCRAIEPVCAKRGLKVSPATGMHVHLGWAGELRALRRLMRVVAYFEPALFSVVAPSRWENPYCEPIREHLEELLALSGRRAWAEHFEDPERRYLTVNPANLFGGMGTVEVRMHSGTIEARKILGWLSLWMRVLDFAAGVGDVPTEKCGVEALPLSAEPQGDVLEMARVVGLDREVVAYLERRREVVAEHWRSSRHAARARVVARAWAGAVAERGGGIHSRAREIAVPRLQSNVSRSGVEAGRVGT